MSLLLLVSATLFISNEAAAQDPQFSQYYAAPLYLNPGLAGINQKGRAGVNYRNQWPSIDAQFETYSFFMDYFFEDYNSAVGFIANTDREGVAGLRSTNLGLQYAYQVRLNDNWTFRPGVEAAYYWRDLNFNNLTFGDQFDANGNVISPSTGEVFNTGLTANFFDLSFGGVVFNPNGWLGLSVKHVLEPNQSLSGSEDSSLPRRFSIHGGYKIPFSSLNRRAISYSEKERSLTPSFNYKVQGEFEQLDIGAYLTLEPILLGFWYRGVPIRQLEGVPNNESIVTMVAFAARDITIGYSFDYTISDLGMASGGAHEISIVYSFSLADPRKPPRSVRELRCPVPFVY